MQYMMKKSNYEPLKDLWIWSEASEQNRLIFELLKESKNEYFLNNQIDRSSQSVADNITEMHGSYYYKVKLNSLRISRKEATETVNHIKKFKDRKIWSYIICDNLTSRYNKPITGINGYINYIRKLDSTISK